MTHASEQPASVAGDAVPSSSFSAALSPTLLCDWMNQLQDGLLLLDEAWDILSLNQRMRTLSGNTLEIGGNLTRLSGFERLESRLLSWREAARTAGEPRLLNWRAASECLHVLLPQTQGTWVEMLVYPLLEMGSIRFGVQIRDVTERLGLAIREQESRLELLQQGHVDSGTGLDVRAFWETRLATEYRRCQRYDEPLSLMLISVPDGALGTLGACAEGPGAGTQDSGARMARALRSALRESDMAGRYAEHQLAIVLPHTVGENACDVALRLRERLQAELLECAAEPLQTMAVCIGVVQRDRATTSYTDLLVRAEDALYEAQDPDGTGVWMAD